MSPTPTTRNVIITGGGRGLGWEMADALVQAGHRVLVTGARAPDELEAACVRWNQGRVAPVSAWRLADVAQWADCQAVAAQCIATFGRIDGLVNNAGRGMREISEEFNRKPALFWQADPQGFRNIVEANVQGAFLMARACVPAMVAQGFGRVVEHQHGQGRLPRPRDAQAGASHAGHVARHQAASCRGGRIPEGLVGSFRLAEQNSDAWRWLEMQSKLDIESRALVYS